MIVAVYCDGGVIEKNPSPYGGTFAFCAVDENGQRVYKRSDVLPNAYLQVDACTNNLSEMWALMAALEYLPQGWSGKVYSDSQITLGRVFWGWKWTNIPASVRERTMEAYRCLGELEPVLLCGHPTQAELKAGVGKRGYPVSVHNVWCDLQCKKWAKYWLETYGEQS